MNIPILLATALVTIVFGSTSPKCGYVDSKFFSRMNSNSRSKRFVMGGSDIKVADIPWIVRVDENRKHTCTGTLISDRHVLTAAHCFTADPTVCKKVFHGNMSICHGTQFNNIECPEESTYKIKRIHMDDPFFKKGCAIYRDIVVAELERPIPKAAPVCLPSSEDRKAAFGIRNTADSYIAGYSDNYDYNGKPDGVNTLLKVANVGKSYFCVDTMTLCTQRTTNVGLCGGDSGGPLFEIIKGRAVQIGVNTSTFGKCNLDNIELTPGSEKQLSVQVKRNIKRIRDIINAKQTS